MKRARISVILCFAALLGGCQSLEAQRLRREIRQIETRVAAVETEIGQQTADIGQQSDSIHTRIRYRPLVAWADLFSAGPVNNRTISFRQTARNGNIMEVSHRCRWNFQRNGLWARIDHSDSTRAALVIERFTATPQSDGLVLSAPLTFDLDTQVRGQYRPPCGDWLPEVSLGAHGHSRPNTVFQLRFLGIQDGALRYTLDLASPASIPVEVRVDLGRFTARFTVPVHNIAQRLVDGRIELLLDENGEIALPGERVIRYRLATVNPQFRTDQTGLQLSTGLDIAIEQ